MEVTGTQEHGTDLLLGQFVVVKGLPKCLGAHQLCTTQYQLKKGTLNGKRCISLQNRRKHFKLTDIYFAVRSVVFLLVHHHY
jgi:epoxyqueuosine reductase QueG